MFGAISLRVSFSRLSSPALIAILVIAAGIATGCGSNGSSTPTFIGNTKVTVMVTSTANESGHELQSAI